MARGRVVVEISVLDLPHDLARPFEQVDFVTVWKEALHCIETPAKSGSHSHCGSGDITYLICHVTVIKGSSDVMEEAPHCI